ncbi:hypothetical protein [Gordonia sp. N1V]|uniref:hypothetical protein n=1 Tax=Gordonia sp. N1V TaxID=3034163 RepID=UPI0023E0BCFD|nr:hypothetical protein [Gordonia sp. N1V]MDF3280460.1 hypothetical protein [Gordonia sp. N1V]
MSDVEDRARDLLADPPIGVETWGPVVEELLAELAKARNVIEQVRAMLEVASDQLHDAADGIGEYNDAHEWLEYATKMVRYSRLIADGMADKVPERYRQKVVRILGDAEGSGQ